MKQSMIYYEKNAVGVVFKRQELQSSYFITFSIPREF